MTRDRGDVDDRALRLAQLRRGCAAAVKRALDVHAENVVPDFLGEPVQIGMRDEMRGAGAVDQDVEPAEPAKRRGDHRLDRGLVRDVGAMADGLSTKACELGHR